jgi:uncharacterized protein YggL (DUF469 family)
VSVPTPECDRLLAVNEQAATLSEFLDWLGAQGLQICEVGEPYARWYPVRGGYERLLARFFKIDLGKVEEEKRAILKAIKEAQT